MDDLPYCTSDESPAGSTIRDDRVKPSIGMLFNRQMYCPGGGLLMSFECGITGSCSRCRHHSGGTKALKANIFEGCYVKKSQDEVERIEIGDRLPAGLIGGVDNRESVDHK